MWIMQNAVCTVARCRSFYKIMHVDWLICVEILFCAIGVMKCAQIAQLNVCLLAAVRLTIPDSGLEFDTQHMLLPDWLLKACGVNAK